MVRSTDGAGRVFPRHYDSRYPPTLLATPEPEARRARRARLVLI
jgi:hypothetical protein